MQEKGSGRNSVVILVLIAIVVSGYIFWQKNYTSEDDPSLDKIEAEAIDSDANLEELEVKNLTAEQFNKATIYLDENHNKKWDSGEETCDICIAKQLVVSNSSGQLTTVSIAGSGSVDKAGLSGNYKSWGFYKDRQVLMPEIVLTDYIVNKEIQIPAWGILGSVTGVNANIQESKIIQSEPTIVRYQFEQLLPIFNKTYNNENKVWVNISNVENDIDKQIMTVAAFARDEMGEITGEAGGYYLDVKWEKAYAENLFTDYQQLEFIIP